MASVPTLLPPSLLEREVISRAVDSAPPLSPSTAAELVAIIGGAS